MSRSRSGSPARKRQRLSSPTYDDQVGDLTQEDLAAFDAINVQLSQALNARKPQEPGSSQLQEPFPSFQKASFSKASNLQDDADNPFKNTPGTAANLSKPSFKPVAFASASSLLVEDYTRSPSPEEQPEEPSFDDWFKPAPENIVPVFQVPTISDAPPMVGFSKASMKGVIIPSEEALAKAKARLDAWNKEEEAKLKELNQENICPVTTAVPNIGFKPAISSPLAQTPMRAAFQPVANMLDTPGTPSPAGFSRPSSRVNTTSSSSNASYRPKQFKPPMLKQPNTPSAAFNVGSSLNPHRMPPLRYPPAASQLAQHPLATAPITAPQFAPVQPTASFVTPLRAKPIVPTARNTPAPFKTPFKSGMGPPLASSTLGTTSQLLNQPVLVQGNEPNKLKPSVKLPVKPPSRKTFSNLTPPAERKTLKECGLRPQRYEEYELEDMDIDITTLSQITPDTAPYYNFHRTSSSPPPSSSSVPVKALGPLEALEELLEKGCDLATRPWVDNHWSLILWKLAAMVAFDPEKESKPDEARWCWSTVMRQLLYRYERELNEGIRPPLRKIANQDAPPAFPMVLCVTNIFWSARREDEDGNPIEPHPELELTDGWYRLRAQIDLPMARAVRRGVIKIGRKIGFAGARLLTEKKDAMEILDAYSSTFLVISGNSSHLMPWHTKLGFTQGPCISTLHSLTADGGVVAALDFVIVKAHPIAYLEFIQHEDGKRETIGPRNEAEEMQVNESWKKRREIEASKLRAEYEKKFARYEGYIDRLERKAGGHLESIRGSDNYPPDHIDSLYDELEYPDTAATLMARISPNDAAWLSLHVRKENEKGRESVGEEIEKELQSICPARQVRSFRVLIIQDARTLRRPANRKAQLTIWDVTNITFDEGDKAGAFEAGQRFMATNLNPQQPKAWMDCSPGSEVFLSTRRDTRWTKIKTIAATT